MNEAERAQFATPGKPMHLMAKSTDPEEQSLRRTPSVPLLRFLRRLSVTEWCALITAVVSILVLIGWTFQINILISVGPHLPAMAVSTAVTFLLCAAALWNLRTHETGVVTGPASQVLALIITGIGVYTLLQYAGDALNNTLSNAYEPVHHRPWIPVNRMAPNSAINFVLLGLAIGLADVHREGERWPAQVAALVAMLNSIMALIGHIYGVSRIFGLTPILGMAVHSAVLIFLLSVGVLYARPNRGIMAILLSDSIAGKAGRRILPILVAVPVALGGITSVFVRLEHGPASIFAYVMIMTGMIVLAWVLWGNVITLHSQVELSAAYQRKVADLEREKIEDELQITEERLAFALEGAGIGTVHWNIVTNRMVWSPTCTRLFGLPAGTAMSRAIFHDRLHPDDVSAAEVAMVRALDTKEMYDMEYRTVWPDGSVHWLAAKGRGYYDTDGTPVRFEGTLQDIDERKRAERALKVAGERQRAMLKEVLLSATGSKLRLCDSAKELPPVLRNAQDPISISERDGLRPLRESVKAACMRLAFPDDRWQGIVTGASEAGMNAVVHGGGKGKAVVSDDGSHIVQVRIVDTGNGIQIDALPKATLAREWSSSESLGHGLAMMLQSADRLWLLTSSHGTTIVLEQERQEPPPAWV